MGLAKSFKTDPDRERSGVILDYGEARIMIARAGGANKSFAKRLRAATKTHKRAIQSEDMDPDLSNSILCRVYAQAVIQSWETKVSNDDGKSVFQSGIDPEDVGDAPGELLQSNQENIFRALTYLPDLFVDIQQQASSGTLYRTQLLEEDAKNL